MMRVDDRRGNDDGPARVVLIVVAIFVVGAAVALLLVRRPMKLPTRPPDCPELAAFDPALAALPVAELERRLRASALVPPFAVESQLAGMRAATAAYRPEKRDCMYRVMLVQAVGSAPAIRGTIPALWGLDRPSAELRRLFLAAELRRPWSADERADVLAQIDENILPALRADSDADREHWRRMYYGLLLTCEASDEELARLGARRPPNCPGLTPRARPAPEGR
jgi:hypothetical protein